MDGMFLKEVLTIIIKIDNDENNITKTLLSLSNQRNIKGTKIILTSETTPNQSLISNIETFKTKLNIEILTFGENSENQASETTDSKYLLFFKSGNILPTENTITETIHEMYRHHWDLLTCKLQSPEDKFLNRLYFSIKNSLLKVFSSYVPYATEDFFLTRKNLFYYNGEFENNKRNYYFLISKKYNPLRYKIFPHFVQTSETIELVNLYNLCIDFFKRNEKKFFEK